MPETLTYQCPNCGAELFFDPDKQKFACEFCLSEFPESELRENGAGDRAAEQETRGEEFCAQMNEYHCPSCGAEIISDESTAADLCPYCHNPVLLTGKLSGQKRPDKIIPFRYGKEEAEKKFLAFAKKKWFIPNDFFRKDQAEKICGIYYPFWVTDADTESRMEGHAERRRVWRRGDTEYTEISRYRVERGGEIHFEDIVTSALSEADKTMLEQVLPYPSSSLIDFSMPYLSGYVAKKRDIEREAITGEIRNRMNQYATTLLQGTVKGYSSVHVSKVDVHVSKSHWDYTLMPIWLLTYQKRGKTYTFAMNGYTGKLYGELPISLPKILILAGAVAAPLTALFTWIGGMLL